jgi:hypothetical protein
MKKLNHLLLAVSAFIAPIMASAHPGHGETEGFSIIHYMVETDHAVVLGALALCAGIYYLYAKSKKQTQK